jgi:hypothetical protein
VLLRRKFSGVSVPLKAKIHKMMNRFGTGSLLEKK